MISAVLDTNVVVSAHLKAGGRQALLLDLAMARRFLWYVSEELLEEYEGVLLRKRFGLDPEGVAKSMRLIRNTAKIMRPDRRLRVTRDPDDNKVLDCAVAAGATYLVTGNLRHFPMRFEGVRVISPREFQIRLAAELEP